MTIERLDTETVAAPRALLLLGWMLLIVFMQWLLFGPFVDLNVIPGVDLNAPLDWLRALLRGVLSATLHT